jgi:hypothetical protein
MEVDLHGAKKELKKYIEFDSQVVQMRRLEFSNLIDIAPSRPVSSLAL